MHLVDTTMFYAPQSGGVKRYLLAKRNWLAAHSNLKHTLLIPGERSAPAVDGIATVAAPPLPFSGGYRFPLRGEPWCRQLLQLAPDIIEAGDPYVSAWAVKDAAQTLGVPAVAFHHSDLERLLSLRFGSWTSRPTLRYLRALYKEFDVIAAPSRVIQAKLQAIGVERTVVQPLGVDTRLFHPSRRVPNLREELGLSADTRLLAFAGRFAKEKNLPTLVKAMGRLGMDYHLLLIGGKQHDRLASNVSLLPYQGQATLLARYLASVDVVVHAGDMETFGLVLAEAMACGRPVVGVEAGAVPEVVDSEVGLLVPRARPEMLAEGIHAIFDQDIEQLGANARRRAENRHSWELVLQSLLALYEQLAESPNEALREFQRVLP